MTFDGEEWPVRGDTVAREYLQGGVSNRLEVVPVNGDSYSVNISVPTSFFSWLTEVMGVTAEGLAAKPVAFYLTQVRKQGWVFGFDRGAENEDPVDLWPYKSLPPWARRERSES